MANQSSERVKLMDYFESETKYATETDKLHNLHWIIHSNQYKFFYESWVSWNELISE